MREIDPALFSPYERDFLPAEFLSSYAFSLCGGPCAGLFKIKNNDMLSEIVRICLDAGLPYKVLGSMTNVLVSDDGYDGVVLLNRKGKIRHENLEDGTVVLSADSGNSMASVVRYCCENGFSGFEWASGLPGTAGGAVCGNAGAFGSDVSQTFSYGTIIDENGKVSKVYPEDMKFAYRSSSMKRPDNYRILLNVSFRLGMGDKTVIAGKGEAYKQKRRDSQPFMEHSLGSVFKNPAGDSAGRLIENAGLKGFGIGEAHVSMKHANFFVTEKGVTSSDYYQLIRHVQNVVFAENGILLEPEIEFLGFSER